MSHYLQILKQYAKCTVYLDLKLVMYMKRHLCCNCKLCDVTNYVNIFSVWLADIIGKIPCLYRVYPEDEQTLELGY